MQDYLDNAEPRTIAMLLIGIVLLLVAAEASLLLVPQIRNYVELDRSFQTLNQAANSGQSISNQLQDTQLEVEKLSRRLHGDMARLPEKQMESFIIGRLQRVSWETDVELVSVQPGIGKQVQNFSESLFDVRLTADYFSFFDWLQTINEELGFIVVKIFEITPAPGKADDNPKLTIQLTLVSYRVTDNVE